MRVFSVIRYESVIHEFDPWFNYRTTKYLTEKGVYDFWNWYDSESWHPLGRVIGGTIYPGIMVTSSLIKWTMDFLAFPLEIRNVCVFLAPIFAGFTSVSTYLLTKECTNRVETGLLAALFIAIVPSYISRSVAGSYDNEAVAIWALVNTFYFWIKAVNTGSILWSVACTLQYFYMVAAWGGYSFIINIIPIFVLGTMFINKFNMRIYVAYSVFYTLGSLMAMLVTFVNFQVIRSSEHLASHCVFFIMNAFVLIEYVKKNLQAEQFQALTRLAMTICIFTFLFAFIYLTLSGATRFSGRSMTLLDPTYAKKFVPIIASVSEHQPTSWSSYFFDLGYLIVFMPIGFYYCLVHKCTLGKLFLAMYGVLATYFSCVMIRLMLVLAPVACIIAAIAVSEILRKAMKSIRVYLTQGQENSEASIGGSIFGSEEKASKKKGQTYKPASKGKKALIPFDASVAIVVFILFTMSNYIYHSTMLASEAYSSPSIIMSGRRHDGTRYIIDDYREAYYWIKQNTPKEAKIMSWWDYGYQITGMSNRTVLVDNNTWNNTHIATVGRAMASNEEEAYKIARHLDANYVLVIFGGLSNYSGDDISKFLWMVRIAAGVFPQIKENNYYNRGHYRVDKDMSPTMRESLMYKLCYYRFGEVRTQSDKPAGYDSVRSCEIGRKQYDLKYFRESYSSTRWLVRIYEVLPLPNRAESLTSRFKGQAQKANELYGSQDAAKGAVKRPKF